MNKPATHDRVQARRGRIGRHGTALAWLLVLVQAQVNAQVQAPTQPQAGSDALPAEAVIQACAGIPVQVQGGEVAEIALACGGASDAIGFSARLGLRPPPSRRIELVPRLPDGLRSDAVGCYATASQRILVLRYAQFLQRREWLGVPVQPALYRAVVAHEVAHALAACRSSPRPLPTAGHEYFAYVVMFASLPGPLRDEVLRRLPGCGFTDTAQINDLVYGFDPMRFGADAWRHWSSQRDGVDYLRRLLDGQVVDELPCP